MAATFEDLPPELLLKILSQYIESEGHQKFSQNVVPVCSTWWKLSPTPSLWKSIRVEHRNYEREWNYLLSLSERETLHHTESLNLPKKWPRTSLDPKRLRAVLSNIRDLKSLEISSYCTGENTMTIVAEHCPNLERLRMEYMCLAEDKPLTLEQLGPILAVCGPKLKHLQILGCDIEDSEQVISEISAKCMSLETFEWHVVGSKFPIYEVMRGCPRLQKLILINCKFVTTGGNDCCGFKDLRVLQVFTGHFNGLDMCNLLKDSSNLEHLELKSNHDFIFSDVSKIPSNKVTVLHIYNDNGMNSVALEQAVNKWKHTLLRLGIWGQGWDITSVLRTYLKDNQCPKLEILGLDELNVDRTLLKEFLQNCQNLKRLQVYVKLYWNREEIMEFLNFL